MKGLLIKDWKTLLKQMKVMLVIVVVFACIPGTYMAAFALFYAAMLPITALAYDERAKWDELAAMMPYTARSIVGSKYVLGLTLVLPVLALSMLSRLIVHSTPIVSEDTMALLITACLSLILMAIDLPFMFHFGVEKGRLIYILLTCAFVLAGVNYAGKLADAVNGIGAAMVTTVPLLLLAAAVIALLISYLISVRVYRARRGYVHKKRTVTRPFLLLHTPFAGRQPALRRIVPCDLPAVLPGTLGIAVVALPVRGGINGAVLRRLRRGDRLQLRLPFRPGSRRVRQIHVKGVVLVLLPLLYGHAYAADHHKQHDHKNPQPGPVPRQLLSPSHMRSPKFRRNCIFRKSLYHWPTPTSSGEKFHFPVAFSYTIWYHIARKITQGGTAYEAHRSGGQQHLY